MESACLRLRFQHQGKALSIAGQRGSCYPFRFLGLGAPLVAGIGRCNMNLQPQLLFGLRLSGPGIRRLDPIIRNDELPRSHTEIISASRIFDPVSVGLSVLVLFWSFI